MKNLFIVLVTTTACFAACTSSDKKAGPTLTAHDREKALTDSANFTSIEWLDSTTLDLGKVKEGQVVEVTYRFRNSGNKPLVISDVSASCGCTVPEKPEKPFAPGEEGVIKAKFDSKGRPHGEARKSVYVNANTAEHQQELNFTVQITD